MLSNFEQKFKNLTDEQLEQCYHEIKEYNKKGMMGDTLVRQIRNEIAKEIGSDNWDSTCSIATIPSILMEIANRRYENE